MRLWMMTKAPVVRTAGASLSRRYWGSIAPIHVAPARTPRGRNQTTDGAAAAIRIGRAADEEARTAAPAMTVSAMETVTAMKSAAMEAVTTMATVPTMTGRSGGGG